MAKDYITLLKNEVSFCENAADSLKQGIFWWIAEGVAILHRGNSLKNNEVLPKNAAFAANP